MMKTCHDNELVKEMLKNHNMFDVEKSMYDQIVPALEKLLNDAGIQVRFGPNSYELSTSEPHILLENLCLKGFKNVNRLEGLDMEHMESVLFKLAQWHAASAVYAEKTGGYEDKYLYGFYRKESREMMNSMHEKLHVLFIKSVQQYSNYDVYAQELVSNCWESMYEFCI